MVCYNDEFDVTQPEIYTGAHIIEYDLVGSCSKSTYCVVLTDTFATSNMV